ncbi:cardio acceleratory peptide 2b [Armigeres subalbatus]|uniref:cardio acceleratory peptide 2b n=1 Tax=Armigeres subalbatus TaxID=124917 RepID=UPI002ED568EF
MQQVVQFRAFAYVSLMLVVLSTTVEFCCADVSDLDSIGDARHKRGPTGGLFAFPRVGRSDPDLFQWGDVQSLPLEDYEDYPIRESKRQGLVPFPRVGRAAQNPAFFYWPWAMTASGQLQKRASNSGANSGMWFGPRLGKRASAASTEIKGTDVYTPRLGRNMERQQVEDAGDLNARSSSNRSLVDIERLFRLSLSSGY